MQIQTKKYLKYLPVAAGAILGYAYYYFIGCNSGACAIQSNPYYSTIYGAIIGAIFLIPDKKKNQTEKSDGE
ncbi:MAG TPA: DUF6132 family protein [Ignavibacteriaceae bacterium]|jgi:hypothetical protein|nr:DUF6132 family protein [Ignavibacteriaceae bacterium]